VRPGPSKTPGVAPTPERVATVSESLQAMSSASYCDPEMESFQSVLLHQRTGRTVDKQR
jgi:hypothetical protein